MKPALNQIRVFNESTHKNFKYTYFIIIDQKEDSNVEFWICRRLDPSCEILHFITQDLVKYSNYVPNRLEKSR